MLIKKMVGGGSEQDFYYCFFLPSANEPFSIPAVKPNSLHNRFTSLSAFVRSFVLLSFRHLLLDSLHLSF